MRNIGYWIESLKDKKYFPPQGFVGEQDPTVKKMTIDYLSSGIVYRQYRGFSWCRFGCNASASEMGSRDLTDGEWVWPQGLVHYVAKHSVILPHEFIDHAQEGKKCACDVDNLPRPSDDFWVKWCDENVSGHLKRKLSTARADADAKYLELRQEYFKNVEREKGISEEKCMTRVCTNNALKDIVFCAECANKLEDDIDPGEAAYHHILEVINA